MPETGSLPAQPAPTAWSRSAWVQWAGAGVAALVALAWFELDPAGEPGFVDEWAMYSQSYFADLLIRGDRDTPAWHEYLGADVPPTAWAIAARASVTAMIVAGYLPLAWDRYLLPLQAGSALLAAGVTSAAADRLTD